MATSDGWCMADLAHFQGMHFSGRTSELHKSWQGSPCGTPGHRLPARRLSCNAVCPGTAPHRRPSQNAVIVTLLLSLWRSQRWEHSQSACYALSRRHGLCSTLRTWAHSKAASPLPSCMCRWRPSYATSYCVNTQLSPSPGCCCHVGCWVFSAPAASFQFALHAGALCCRAVGVCVRCWPRLPLPVPSTQT